MYLWETTLPSDILTKDSAEIQSEKSVAEHFHDLFPSMTEKEVRNILGMYLFPGKLASRLGEWIYQAVKKSTVGGWRNFAAARNFLVSG